MLQTILIIYTLYTLLKIYLSVMEVDFVKKSALKKAVILSNENYQKAASYKVASERFNIVHNFYDYFVFVFWLGYGLKFLEVNLLQNISLTNIVLFLLAFFAINYILSLPFDIYSTFVKDKKFGFSTIDVKTFVLDQLKSAGIFLVFGSAFFYALSWIIENVNLWWFWGFVLSFGVIVFINMIYPTLIAPIFNKFSPLNDESLKESIESLLKFAGLKSNGVFTIDAGKRDNRLNAYFGGLGKSKRVVLFDTLIKKLNKNELLAVLGHELGHFKHNDILKNIAFMGALFFFVFFLIGNIPTELYQALNLKQNAHSTIALFLLLSPVIFFIFMPLFGIISRHNEYEADAYGSECQSSYDLSQALIKLADENKSFPYSHKLYIAFYHTHPPLVERLKNLGVEL